MTERVEQRLGNYLLTRLIGTGTFADVYLGMHVYLRTPVALKVPRVHMDAYALEEFLKEARQISQLVHPHIIRVLDFGIEDDTPFLVMDYAPGGNLRVLHPAGTIVPLASVLSYVTPIASALQYAHDQHLIHLDLKPENLLLGPDHEIYVSDFGLSLIASALDTFQVQSRFRTLTYMAPEQLHGQPCPASDQYALAVMVYDWLSGRLPFEGRPAEPINQHMHASPAALREGHPELPPAVEHVIFTALSQDPARRYMDVLTFATTFKDACQSISPSATLPAMPAETPGEARPVLGSSHGYARILPVFLNPLIGRKLELQAARTRLLRPEVRLLTFTGTPGVGKTRLALALGSEVQEEFTQGVCFVGLSAISEPELLVPTIRDALGLQESLDLSPFEHIVAYVRDKSLLLLLDNFEHLLPAAAQLVDLLTACRRLKVLVTSRAALRLRGEYELDVPPLAMPDLQQLPAEQDLSQVEAVALFLQCAEARSQGFTLTRDNAAVIAEICVRLGGVPLAIELAAARIKLFPPQALLARLEHGLELLSGGTQDLPFRQQTLRSTLAWSYEHLPREEQALFRRLAVFAGGFSLEAAEAVVPVPGALSIPILDGIAALIDKSLLKQREEGPELHLSLLEFVREYASECLAASGEREAAHEAHAHYYLALAERAEPALVGSAQARWFEQLEREGENMRATLQWLLERHERGAALRLPTALLQFWIRQGRMSEGRRFLEQALEAPREDNTDRATLLRARALQAAGILARYQNDPEHARGYLEASLQLLRQLEDTPGIALSLYFLGSTTYIRGEVEAGWAMMQEGLDLSRASGASATSAEILVVMGGIALFRGEYAQAQELLTEGQVLLTERDDVWGQAVALYFLGVVAFAQGDLMRVRRLSERSLALFRKLGMPMFATEVLAVLALALMNQGEEGVAGALLEEALALVQRRANTEEWVRVLYGLGQLAWRKGKLAQARALYEEAVTRMQGRVLIPRIKWVVASCLEGLGAIAMAQGQSAWAVQLLAAAATARATHGYASSLGIEQPAYDRILAEARTMLGEQAFAAAWAGGQVMTPQQALTTATQAPLPEEVDPLPATS